MLKTIRLLAALAFVEGVIAFAWLASFPTENDGFSSLRLIFLIGILVTSIVSLVGFIYFRSGTNSSGIIERIVNFKGRIFISFLLISISLCIWVAILFKELLLLQISESTYARLVPIALYVLFLCLPIGGLFLIPNFDKNIQMDPFKSIWKPTLILLGIFLAVWILIYVSHIGFVYDNVGLSWGPPGTPITFAQVNLIFAISIWLAFAFYMINSRILVQWFSFQDVIIFLGLWFLAVVLWWHEPMSPTHFAPPPLPPNNEYYPNSDALIFDRSSYHLIYGTGFSDQLVRRPLYVGMLAFFHQLAGSSYDATIFLQILVLALIPALMYLLTSNLSNRLAGLIAGSLILLREKNAIELSGDIVTSHAKLMMSDLIATLGVILFVYVTVKLLSREDRDTWMLAIAGALIGLGALIRAQVLILVPPFLLFIILSRKPPKLASKESLLMLLGLVLVMSPWVWRNWNLTGTFVLDDRGEEGLLARNYSFDPTAFPRPSAGETERDFSARIKQGILTFIFEHPDHVLFFVSNHFFRNMATSVMYIAPAYSTDSPSSLVSQVPFWDEWDGKLPGLSGVSLIINLGILAFGIGIAQAKYKLAGWFPFIVFLSYSLGNALVRSSGWRFSLPVDWVIAMYYGIALAYLPSRINFSFNKDAPTRQNNEEKNFFRNPIFGPVVFTILFLIGASVPMAERLIPARDFENFTNDARKSILQEAALSSSEIETFLEQKNAVFFSGIALYPRYFRPNSRIQLVNTPEERYLHFWVINNNDYQIVFPLQDPPDVFPHISTVSVIGCKEDTYILPWAVIMHTPSKQVLIHDSESPLVCPLVEPN